MDNLEPRDIDAAARTLAVAFHDDPFLALLQPDEARREAAGRWLFTIILRIGLPHGQVWANEDASAVAVWLPPGKTDISTIAMLRAGMVALPLKVGPRQALRFLQTFSAIEPLHKAVDGPHWYLGGVGTRPERQGQGLGSELLRIGTDQADAAGLPCYLETGTDANVAFYGKRGFEITGEAEAGGYPVYGMVRQPQPAS